MTARHLRPLAWLAVLATGCSLSTGGVDPVDGDEDRWLPDDGSGELLVEADADGPLDADAEAEADAPADADAEAEADAPVDADAEAEADAPVDADAEAEADAPVDADAEAEADAPIDAGPVCIDPVHHDEDGDTLDDACDVCPTWFDPDQRDADGDGLGDACEVPGNPALLTAVAAFDSFWPSRLDPAAPWFDDSGAWTAGTDVVTGSQNGYNGNRSLDEPAAARYAAEVRFTYPSGTGIGPEEYAGVLFGVGPFGWWTCGFSLIRRDLTLWRYEGGSSIYQYLSSPSTVEPWDRAHHVLRRVRVVWDGTSIVCAFDNAAGDSSQISYPVAAGDHPALGGSAGLCVYDATATFHSYVLYR
jgi:hypothetical protein